MSENPWLVENLQEYLIPRGQENIKLQVLKFVYEGNVWQPSPTKDMIFKTIQYALLHRDMFEHDINILSEEIEEDINGWQGRSAEWYGEERHELYEPVWCDFMSVR